MQGFSSMIPFYLADLSVSTHRNSKYKLCRFLLYVLIVSVAAATALAIVVVVGPLLYRYVKLFI